MGIPGGHGLPRRAEAQGCLDFYPTQHSAQDEPALPRFGDTMVPGHLAPEGSAAERPYLQERVMLLRSGARQGREAPFADPPGAMAASSAVAVAAGADASLMRGVGIAAC